MTAESESYAQRRIKHLEMIQGALSRMSGNSGTIKRYAVVVTLYSVRTLYAEQNADGTYSILNDLRVIAADITGFDASHVYLTLTSSSP